MHIWNSSGWTGDDCLMNPDDCLGNRCLNGATCLDGLGFYTCICSPGRTGKHVLMNMCKFLLGLVVLLVIIVTVEMIKLRS